MLNTVRADRAMVVAPNGLAAQAGLRVLADGGNALEAMVAAAATIAVVYPHMNGLGGDNFWLVHEGAGARMPLAIDACGAAARAATIDAYRARGHRSLPTRGAEAAITVAGAVSGWSAALDIARRWGGRLGLSRLFEDAVHYARRGVPVTRTQAENTAAKRPELEHVGGFGATYLVDGRVPEVGSRLANPALAATLEHLASRGLDDFYRGELARALGAALNAAGSPLDAEDLAAHRALDVAPLELSLDVARVFNLPPPTQGLASLLILALFARMRPEQAEGFDFVHRMVECTKQAFLVRDAEITDPAFTDRDPRRWLEPEAIAAMERAVDRFAASPWPRAASAGDTVWLGAIDGEGRAVSMIQSLYWEFGSGLTLTEHGITWQNRGVSFSLDAGAVNPLTPMRRPFHTIQPAMALFHDGRVMPYGCMGGEGQPQSQAAVFSRYAWYHQQLQQAVTAPRWLLGRTWGDVSTHLRLESRFHEETVAALASAGHAVQRVGPFEEVMGHAGALVRHADGRLEGAADPRGDGAVAAL